jgi:hypothetical protein
MRQGSRISELCARAVDRGGRKPAKRSTSRTVPTPRGSTPSCTTWSPNLAWLEGLLIVPECQRAALPAPAGQHLVIDGEVRGFRTSGHAQADADDPLASQCLASLRVMRRMLARNARTVGLPEDGTAVALPGPQTRPAQEGERPDIRDRIAEKATSLSALAMQTRARQWGTGRRSWSSADGPGRCWCCTTARSVPH